MTAPTHRLALVQNITVAGSTYGSGTYGEAGVPYGQRATDPADLQSYVAVPMEGPPDFRFRVGDSHTDIVFQILAFGGPFESGEGTVLDLSTVDTARFRIDRASPGEELTINTELTVDTVNDKLTCSFTADDMPSPGLYRALIVVWFTSGRRLTIPINGLPTITVTTGSN